MKSIKVQIGLAMTLVAVAVLILINGAQYYLLSTSYDDTVKNNLTTSNALVAQNVESFISKAYAISEELTENSDVKTMQTIRQEAVLKNSIARNPYFELYFVQGNDGFQTGRSSGKLGDRSGRWWFKKIMSDGNPFVTKSYFGVSSKSTVTSIILPIKDQGKQVGVFGADLSLASLQKLTEQYSNEKEGKYTVIIDGEGVIIAHPNTSYVEELYNYKAMTKTVKELDQSGKPILDESGNIKTKEEPIEVSVGYKAVLESVLKGESSVSKFKDKEGVVYAAYSPIKLPGVSDNWSVLTIQKEKEAKAFVMNSTISTGMATLVIAIIIFFVAQLYAGRIAKPIVAMTATMKNLSQLDFRMDLKDPTMAYLERKDEIGMLLQSIKQMRDNVANFIAMTTESAEQVAATSEELTATSEQAASSSEEVARTLEEIARGASEQAKDTEHTAHNIESLGQLLDTDSGYIDHLNEAASKIEDQKEAGFLILSELIKNTKRNEVVTETVFESIMSNNDSAEKIETASAMIESIASQTNLLALNAAIEAARAGEAGRGFAVVADEIRKLAEQSNSFTSDIKAVISELKAKSVEAVEAMNGAKTIVHEQSQSVEMTEEKFKGIAEAIDAIKMIIQKLNGSTAQMTQNKEVIIELVQNLSAISEENAASTEEASASMQEQSATIQEIANSGENLAHIAEELRLMIDKFKI